MSTGDPPDPRRPGPPEDPGQPVPPKPAAARADKGPVRAGHGYSNEVRWNSGQGHQPYANRGSQEAPPSSHGEEFEGGDRGSHSGTTLEQMAQVKRKP